jgi:hypothetical protein
MMEKNKKEEEDRKKYIYLNTMNFTCIAQPQPVHGSTQALLT